MRRPERRALIHAAVFAVLFSVAMAAFVFANYIDVSVITAVYLPVAVVCIAAMLCGWHVFGYTLGGAAVLGLVVEYLVHLRQPHPTMQGAFVNTVIIAAGLIAGVILQVVVIEAKTLSPNVRRVILVGLSRSCWSA